METAVDLSEPGDITVPFHQTCSISHGEAIYLRVSPELEDEKRPEELLADLAATVVIEDSAGEEAAKTEISDETINRWIVDEEDIFLTSVPQFANGEYTAAIRIDSGAAVLAGKKQVMYAKYQLCGLERLPATIAGMCSFASGLVGLIAAVCVLPGLLRRGFLRTGSAQTERESDE